jgi:hypothetical protein
MNALGTTTRTRLVPDLPLPPYSYVPGRFPHPVSDPSGHRFGEPAEKPPPLDPDYWEESRAYLYGIDLFNHGYYWEAHEAWEGLWHACGRLGPVADFLKGLIKLAAAGVKVREGKPHGVASHAARAQEIFWQTQQRLGGREARYLGLPTDELINFADAIGRRAPSATGDADPGVRVVFDFVLKPCPGGGGR